MRQAATRSHCLPCLLAVLSPSAHNNPSPPQSSTAAMERGNSPEPSGSERTNVGSIFTVAVGFVSLPRPLTISAWKRVITSSRTSSERRRWYRYLSTWGEERCHPGARRLLRAQRCRTLLCVLGRFLRAEKTQELPSHLHWFSNHEGAVWK